MSALNEVLWGDEVALDVDAPAERVWSLLADVTRMGEWSPICHRCEWLGGRDGPAEVGARFVGYNRLNGARWSRTCEVTAAEPGREFAFRTFFKGEESTRWRYRFDGGTAGDGTTVTESYEVIRVPRWIRLARRVPGMAARSFRQQREGMEETLRRLKVAAESQR